MKAAFEKAVNLIGGYARGIQRRQEPPERGADGVDYQIEPTVLIQQDLDDPALSTLMSSSAEGGDDVLFSKNNVLLKLQGGSPAVWGSDRTGSSPTSGHTRMDSLQKGSLDNHIMVPGFLFVTTRGSNFGTTLILNWAPNSSMVVPKCSSPEKKAIDLPPIAASSLPHNPSCSSISIDLCAMEMIRIFYCMDDGGFMISGELVVKSKEEDFKVSTLNH